MTRSIPALALVVGGLLFGCGGLPEEDEVAVPEGEVSQSAVKYIKHTGVNVAYNPANDNVTVNDTLSDGHSAVAVIYNPNTGSTTECWNSNGVGTSHTCNRDYPNNPLLRIKACTGESSTMKTGSCSAFQDVRAFAPTK
ncbi:hypothetical protein HJC22_02230 [Corallococcus exiguus]|uniref:hypothetical protein n=1 Tax=Corallococcus exiguus TaxID=83462 RepID=UPI001471A6DE|nr:hypothetical protein [Corallococcus exiguus]NNC14549.1 hypothetical protein [Corallococcus exiguus]